MSKCNRESWQIERHQQTRRLGPFQRMARNAGVDLEIVERLPHDWPLDLEDVADALYEAGECEGEGLLRMAQLLWKHRPYRLPRGDGE